MHLILFSQAAPCLVFHTQSPFQPVEAGERRLGAAEADERHRLGDELGVVGALAQLPVARVQVAVHVGRRLREQRVEPHPFLYLGI